MVDDGMKHQRLLFTFPVPTQPLSFFIAQQAISPACVTCCDPNPDPAADLDSDPDPSPALDPVFARGWGTCLAVLLPIPAIQVTAAYADLALAAAAACYPEHPGFSLVARLGRTAERFRLLFAVTASAGRLSHPAGVAQIAGYPAV